MPIVYVRAGSSGAPFTVTEVTREPSGCVGSSVVTDVVGEAQVQEGPRRDGAVRVGLPLLLEHLS